MTVIKKTLAIHPVMDKYVRILWSQLVRNGFDATYSLALNYMLLAHIWEVVERKGGFTKGTLDILDKFLEDNDTINELNAEDYKELLGKIPLRRTTVTLTQRTIHDVTKKARISQTER